MSELTSPVTVKVGRSQELVFNFVGEANMTGQPSGLWIGTAKADGGGHTGLVFLRKSNGEEGVILDGENGFSARDHAGKTVFNFAGEANITGKPSGLWIGTAKADGGGHTGLVFLRRSNGEEGIVLDGENGFSARDHAGKMVFNFAGEANMTGTPSGLWIGTAKADGGGHAGLIVVRDAAGNDSIVLDGAQGDIILANADCAEEFEVNEADDPEPGSVVVLDSSGKLTPANAPYDKRVVGVVSGAGDLRPGMILHRQAGSTARRPVAVMGKVNCRVNADIAPVEIGDLLTTSAMSGYAMKAEPTLKAFGAVIGKALSPLTSGLGLIPILVTLQ